MNQDAKPSGPGAAAMAHAVRGRRTVARLIVAVLAGVIAAVVASLLGGWQYVPAIAWDVTGAVFCALAWRAVWPMSAAATAERATEEDLSRANTDVLLLTASVVSLAAVTLVLAGAHHAHGVARVELASIGLTTVAVSWFTVHTIFMLRYALLYYAEPAGGIDFGSDDPPSYRDFAYLALTLGMTFQVSDTALRSTALRATALRHALLSYLFGAIILAVAINLVAGLGV
ncbi:MAG TPA: DUF1345 domain-containing protein [Streptosporangiaceae bacterium]|jgi:uncharacterized membrane protein|nr:DUF1345 domain-containing protein [Streptosporangiaceae bacterium]